MADVLRDAFERAPDGAETVIAPRTGSGERSLYSAMRKRLHRAGIKPWTKLFVNLRSSRETELVERFPIHVVAAWLGNSPAVAANHYLQVTADHFADAVNPHDPRRAERCRR